MFNIIKEWIIEYRLKRKWDKFGEQYNDDEKIEASFIRDDSEKPKQSFVRSKDV